MHTSGCMPKMSDTAWLCKYRSDHLHLLSLCLQTTLNWKKKKKELKNGVVREREKDPSSTICSFSLSTCGRWHLLSVSLHARRLGSKCQPLAFSLFVPAARPLRWKPASVLAQSCLPSLCSLCKGQEDNQSGREGQTRGRQLAFVASGFCRAPPDELAQVRTPSKA